MKISIKKILFITLLSFLLMREILPFQFSYYKLNSSSSTTYRSNCTSTEGNGPSLMAYDEINLDEIDEMNIIYDGLGDERNTYIKGQDIIVKVSTPKLGNWKYYIPLYKKISIRDNFDYRFQINLKRNSQAKDISCHGTVDVASSHIISGICSGRKAKELIENKIHEEIMIKIQDKIQEIIDDME